MEGSDGSAGYDAIADTFVAVRSRAGERVVSDWARTLPKGGMVIDVGCGHGEPLTRALLDAGLSVRAIDASPRLVEAFKTRFPGVPIRCERAEVSGFFGEMFDGVLIVGLVFLLEADDQAALIERVGAHVKPGGRVLMSAPWQRGDWDDVLTGQACRSLGREAYKSLLERAGLCLSGTREDEGGSHYYLAERAPVD